jgi:hypothetical protein
MRDFGTIKLSNSDYNEVVSAFIKFWRNTARKAVLSGECPATHFSWKLENKLRERFEWGDFCRVCEVLPMFPNDTCPCYTMGEKAFDALDEFIKEYGQEFMEE